MDFENGQSTFSMNVHRASRWFSVVQSDTDFDENHFQWNPTALTRLQPDQSELCQLS